MMDDALEPQKEPLDYQQSWTFYFFCPGTTSVVCFLLEGLSHPPQEPLNVSSSSAREWALAQGQQETEEGEEEGPLGV